MGSVTELSDGEPARARYPRSASALFGALIAALGLIAVIWGLSWFQHRDIPDPARTIDYSADLSTARASAPFDVLAPQPAPAGWRPTSAQWDGIGPIESWHLGFLTPAGEYVGLEQSNATTGSFVSAHTSADEPGRFVTINGRQWQTLSSSDGSEQALVRSQGGATTLVTGTATSAELRVFAGSLRGS
jgi:Protein of unknown function (DUF4245)